MPRGDRRRAGLHKRGDSVARSRRAVGATVHRKESPEPATREGRVLALQRSAGNYAVTGLLTERREETATIQRKSVVEWAKDLIGGEPTAAEVTLEEMNSELGTVIDHLEKAKTVADAVGQDQFTEGLGGVIDGLNKVKGPIGKVLGAQKTAREVRQFYTALQKLRKLDLNKDYEAGADAMSDLAEAAGELGGKLLPEEAGAVGAYLEIIKGSGAVFKMGARLRKKTELKIDPEKYHEELQKEIDAIPTPPKASASGEVKLEDLPKFIADNIATATPEDQRAQNYGFAGWGNYERDFNEAYGEFMGYHRQQQDIGLLGRLGSEYRKLKIYKKDPWQKAEEALLKLERWCGSLPHTSVSFQPALRTWAGVKP